MLIPTKFPLSPSYHIHPPTLKKGEAQAMFLLFSVA